jgi:hypothetical protein
MSDDARALRWVTPARIVGPSMVAILFIGAAVAGGFAATGRLMEAIVALLFAIMFLLLGLADLIGELIMLSVKRTGSSAP